MKYIIDGVIVVEGSGDSAYLSSFIDAEFVTTNGYEISTDKMEYLKAVSAFKKVILLTDSDKAGEAIRKKVNEHVEVTNVRVNIERCNKNNKHGVAECEKNEILNKLSPFFTKVKKAEQSIFLKDLKSLSVNNREIYLFIGKKFNAYFRNTKQFLRCLNSLKVTKKDIEMCVEEYWNGNK